MLHAFVPIWLLVAAGYAARRWRLVGDSAVAVLTWSVFHLAMPAALFVPLARTPLARLRRPRADRVRIEHVVRISEAEQSAPGA